MTAETAHQSSEVAVGHVADQHLSKRRLELRRRLEKWANWIAGGIGVQAVAVGLGVIAPWVFVPLCVAGMVGEGVGTLGIVGNRAKLLLRKNR